MRLKIETPKGTYRYKFIPIFEGIKPINKEIAKENLFLLKEVCDRHDVHFLLFFGTLLGAVREHDFITHDEDIDLVMPKERMPDFLSLLFELRKEGFEVARFEKRGFMSIIRKGEYIDFYFFQPYPPDQNLMYCACEICRKEFITETTTMEFLGGHFLVPKDYLEFIEEYFGEDWRTPIQIFDFKKTKVQLYKEHFIQYVKTWLPISLTERIQKRKDSPLLEKKIKNIYSRQKKTRVDKL